MTQSALAKRSGLGEGTISNILSGERGLGTDSVEKLARGLKVPPEEVFLAAIGRPLKPDQEWAVELTHEIEKLPPNLRGVAEKMVRSITQDIEE